MEKFWVVTEPKKTSTIADCVFETDAPGFVLQVRGGLSEADEPKIHATRFEALQDARHRVEGRGPQFARLVETLRQAEREEEPKYEAALRAARW